MARPGKIRKEIYFTSAEMRELEALSRHYGIDKTAMIRVLIVIGKDYLQRAPHPVDDLRRNTETPAVSSLT